MKTIKTTQNFRVICEHQKDNIRWVEATFTDAISAINYATEWNQKVNKPYHRIVEEKQNGKWYDTKSIIN